MMTIVQLCDALRAELIKGGYEYGFVVDGQIYKPNMARGFDAVFYHLANTISRVQDPEVTKQKKVGTCIDAVLVMRQILDAYNVPSKIWLTHHEQKNKVHTVLTFLAESKTVYLELTPQSSKPWYGKELVYDDEDAFLQAQEKDGYEIFDVTDQVIIGERPYFLLDKLK
ncbi:MAG: hypothetical protein E7659_05655 [Ruminococcaceae bacterium]|nr:hypothetical protein [Oscillospiraceae bacterium]